MEKEEETKAKAEAPRSIEEINDVLRKRMLFAMILVGIIWVASIVSLLFHQKELSVGLITFTPSVLVPAILIQKDRLVEIWANEKALRFGAVGLSWLVSLALGTATLAIGQYTDEGVTGALGLFAVVVVVVFDAVRFRRNVPK